MRRPPRSTLCPLTTLCRSLAGFTIGTFVVAQGEWRWLFRIPPLITAAVAVLLAIFVKPTPEAAGYRGVVGAGGGSGGPGGPTPLPRAFPPLLPPPPISFLPAGVCGTGGGAQNSE